MKRMKALGISFEGVYMSVSPTRAQWSKFLGTDGDYVVAPAQWNEQAESLCDVFGSAKNYAAVYSEYNGRQVDYHAATMTAAGITFQLAIQTRNSTDTDTLLSVIQSLSRDTMFGRIRFSFRQRNFGRPPIGLQHQVRALANADAVFPPACSGRRNSSAMPSIADRVTIFVAVMLCTERSDARRLPGDHGSL